MDVAPSVAVFEPLAKDSEKEYLASSNSRNLTNQHAKVYCSLLWVTVAGPGVSPLEVY